MAAYSSGTRGLKHSKSTGDLTENTEEDLQNIFKKLRVDIEPRKTVRSRRAKLRAFINRKDRHYKTKSNRELIKEAKFVYRGSSHTKQNVQHQLVSDLDTETDRDLQRDDENVNCVTQIIEKRRKSTTDIKGRELPKGCSQEFRSTSASSLPHSSSVFANDITPDELAAYFEELLNIPKPMSSMAEMMYT